MSTATNSWSQLRQQLRDLESQTENLLNTYSQYASTSKISPQISDDESRTESQLNDVLSQRDNLLAQLSRLLDSEATLTSSALKQNHLSRHRETLREHRLEITRIRTQISTARDRANLLSNVRSDIASYRSANAEDAEANYMLDERERIDRSHSTVDGVLSQAYAINDGFAAQREMLANVNRRIVGAASQIPGVNTLIGKIGAKKRRDGIILGGFIALCCLVFLFFL